MSTQDQQPVLFDQFADENVKAEEAITNGNLVEAAKILVSIIDKDPLNARAFNNIGIISWTKKDWFDAFAMFKKAVTIRADYVDALINLFDASLKLRKVNEILPLLEKSLEINPTLDDIRTIFESCTEQGDEIYRSKRAFAIGLYSPLIEEGHKELEAGNYLKAMEKFILSNDCEGPNAAAYCGLGIISYYQGNYQDAFTLFLESIHLNPLDADTFLNLLDAAKELNIIDKAITIFELYKKDFPELEDLSDEFYQMSSSLNTQ